MYELALANDVKPSNNFHACPNKRLLSFRVLQIKLRHFLGQFFRGAICLCKFFCNSYKISAPAARQISWSNRCGQALPSTVSAFFFQSDCLQINQLCHDEFCLSITLLNNCVVWLVVRLAYIYFSVLSRYVDMIANPEVADVFRKRAKVNDASSLLTKI